MNNNSPSKMRREIDEIPVAVQRLLASGFSEISNTALIIRDLDPKVAVTIARGSSDHVCTYLKYATELLLGIPVASIGPSIASIYASPLKLSGALSIAVSQSGQSPDIVEMARSARSDGALSVAITNDPDSPLAKSAAHPIDILAGAERSVAATKTFVNSAVAGLLLLAEWRGDDELRAAIRALPNALDAAAKINWPEVCDAIDDGKSLFTIGRGPVSAISNEAALKFKETCQIHAESYSSAEVLHGPVSIVGNGFPILAFAAADKAEKAVVEIADNIADKGAQVFVTSDLSNKANALQFIRTNHPLTDPISLIVSFYSMVERVATSRGINPDTPRHLNKVTETV